MNSMTGYGRSQYSDSEFEFTFELTSVNKKHFELQCSLPREWQMLEPMLQEQIRKVIQRGKIGLSLTVKRLPNAAEAALNLEPLEAALRALEAFAAKRGAQFELDTAILAQVWAASMQHMPRAELPKLEVYQPIIQRMLTEAISQLGAMRAMEGKALQAELQGYIQDCQRLLKVIEGHAEGTVSRYRQLLLERLAQAGLPLDLSDERILKEIALFADKTDIAEEITRLKSHLGQFVATLEQTEPVGRKLDFLCQEINREVNTIGSKANSLAVTQAVIEAKSLLEKLREQVQNLE